MQATAGTHSCILQYYYFPSFPLGRSFVFLDPADFRSMIGVSSNASIPSIVTTHPLTERILQVVMAIRLDELASALRRRPSADSSCRHGDGP